MSNKYEIDYQDSKAMWDFQMQTLKIADDYYMARRRYSNNQRILKIELAKSYAHGDVEKKHAEDKAYLILAEINADCRKALEEMIDAEGEYKALEKVIEVRQSTLSFNQSLIKNQIRST